MKYNEVFDWLTNTVCFSFLFFSVLEITQRCRYLHSFGDSGNSNWRSMQYNGLGMVSVALPELNHADEWYASRPPNLSQMLNHE